MPTRHRRHAITETPPVKSALDELRGELGDGRIGHHRLPPVGLMVAAIADRHGLGILHHDRDYDLIAEKSDLDFGSVWLAPAGTI